ncbi:MAG: cysteine hydrolase [Lachnospiraceae bacterium]|nr:cysteine hydrolase [Lachnospiraceae bacterium]
MRKVLVVVDMQNDFTYGALRNEDAIAIIPKVAEKVAAYEGEIIFTYDTHGADYMDTQEGRKLPVPHCIEDTEGWELVPELGALCKEKAAKCYKKGTFGCMQLAQDIARMHAEEPIDKVELVGICTDICVISNAMLIKAAIPNVTIQVDASCCAGVTKESHETALKAMAGCQIEIVE